MTHYPPEQGQSVASYLLAARESETQSLVTLSATCRLIKMISDLVHDLQRERGLTNVNLASGSERLMTAQRRQQVACSCATEALLRGAFDDYFFAGGVGRHASRLLNSVAVVLQGLSELACLRREIDRAGIDAPTMTGAFSRLIACLLDVVNEAADASEDPVVSRALVGVTNFMQGKEYAGQERAWGAIGFAQGRFDAELRQRLEHLQAVQERVLLLYEKFADQADLARWQQLQQRPFAAEQARLRQLIASLSDSEQVASELSEVWYSIATTRIDAMHEFEVQVINDLVSLCQQRLVQARSDYQQQLSTVASLSDSALPLAQLMLLDSQPTGARAHADVIGAATSQAPSPSMRSIYDLIRQQNEHLLRVKTELDEARRALAERKLIEQAKGLLMTSLKLTEAEAYRRMQKRAMESNLGLAEVSQLLLDAARK